MQYLLHASQGPQIPQSQQYQTLLMHLPIQACYSSIKASPSFPCHLLGTWQGFPLSFMVYFIHHLMVQIAFTLTLGAVSQFNRNGHLLLLGSRLIALHVLCMSRGGSLLCQMVQVFCLLIIQPVGSCLIPPLAYLLGVPEGSLASQCLSSLVMLDP